MRLSLVWLLTKNNLRGTFYNSSVNNPKKNNKSTGKTFLILGVAFVLLSFFYNFSIYESFKLLDMTDKYLPTVLGLSGTLTFVFTLLKYESTVFGTKDYEMLESMPLTKKEIVASKVLYLYLFDIVETLIICIPACIFYLVFGGTIIVAILGLLSTLFIPMLPMALSGLISFVFSFVTARMKHKSIFQFILYALYMVIVMLFSFFSSSQNTAFVNGLSLANPLKIFLERGLALDSLYLFYFILINIISIFFLIILISLGYHKINNWHIKSTTHTAYKAGTNIKNKSIFRTLLSKEIKMITSKSMYFVNSVIGPMMGLFMIVLMYFMGKSFQGTEEGTPDMVAYFAVLSIMTCVMMNGISSSTVATISMEGKNFEIFKTYPVEGKKVLLAKVVASLIAPVCFNVISAIIFVILFKPSVAYIILAIICPTASAVFLSLFGLLCNLRWYILEFENETQVLKNSKASMVVTFSSLGINMTAFILSIVLLLFIPSIVPYIIIVFYLIIDLIIMLIYGKKALIRYNHIY